MFISNKEAQDRLNDGRNIFRDSPSASDPASSAPTSGSSAGWREQKAERLRQEQADIEQARARRTELANEDSTISLSHLDMLLSPHVRSKPYTNIETQAAIAETALVLGPTMAGALFDREHQQPRRMAEGYTSGFDHDAGRPKPELVTRLAQIKERLAEKAANKLDATMNALTPQKISAVKRATNLSKIAKDMAAVMDKCSEHKDNEGAGVHFHIYRPESVPETIYETVQVGPKVIDVPSASNS
jgi:hypothetical protein